MTWTSADIPDQQGRVAVVTGGNGGLGLEVVRELARAGALVLMAAHDQAKADGARRRLRDDMPGARVEVRALDLADLAGVRACADAIVADHGRIDLLVNNAGLMGIPRRATVDGFEMQLGVNHLGHFALTGRLLPALLRAPAGRVVSVTSVARFVGRAVDPSDPHMLARYDPWLAYGRSKLANLQFALELHRRLWLAGARVHSLAADPGLSHTDLQARSVRESGGGWSQRFWAAAAARVGMPPARGALPLLRAATDPDARGGHLYAPRYGLLGPPVRRPATTQGLSSRAGRQLWDLSERETGERIDVGALVARAGHEQDGAAEQGPTA